MHKTCDSELLTDTFCASHVMHRFCPDKCVCFIFQVQYQLSILFIFIDRYISLITKVVNPSNFYRRSDLSARSFYNCEESLSSEDISIPDNEYLPSEDENDHLSLYTPSDISSSETSSNDAAPIQEHPPSQGAPQLTPRKAQSLWDSDFDGRQQVSFSGSSTGLLRQITTQNPADIPIALFRQFLVMKSLV